MRFLRKRHVRRHGPPQRSVHRRHGPLGDRSLPRKSSDYIRGAEKNTSPKHLRGKAISPKAPRPQTRTTADMDHRRDQTAADTDRSEIGPYLGGPRTTSGGQKTINAPNPLQPVPENHPCSLSTNHRAPKQQRDRAEASIESDQTLPLAHSAKAIPSQSLLSERRHGLADAPPTHARTPAPTEPHLTHRSDGFTRA